jgi:hypothetical protein
VNRRRYFPVIFHWLFKTPDIDGATLETGDINTIGVPL